MGRFALALILLAGCAEEAPACPECGPPSAELEAIAGRTYLVSRVTFPEAILRSDGTVAAAGLDLDGIDTRDEDPRGACTQSAMDYDSVIGVPGGIDNAGQTLIRTAESTVDDGTTFDDSFAAAVADARIRWALRVGPLGPGAEEIDLELWVIDDPIDTDGAGVPLAGQTLRGHLVSATVARLNGDLAWGYVTADADLVVTGDDVFLMPFDDFRLGGIAVEAGPDAERVTANLGGSFSTEALTALAVELTGPMFGPEIESIFRSIYESTADIRAREDDPSVCERISIGLVLDGVPVEITP